MIADSCRSLLERHPDLLDSRAKSSIEETMDALADMQSLVEDLLKRMQLRQAAQAAAAPVDQPAAR